jgi:5,6-dimethylbenzimidazole synthase
VSHENVPYDRFLELVKMRTSVRRFKPDPLPEGTVEKILEAGRWAMSGANSQPWEFIIVQDPQVKKQLWRTYLEINATYVFWMEQMRADDVRHPAFQLTGSPDEQWEYYKSKDPDGWSLAPVLIVVLGDGRRQWGTVMAGHTFGRGMTHLTDGLANCCQIMHLAAAALGLGTQWVTIHTPEPFKRALGVPDFLTLHTIISVGFPATDRKKVGRRPLAEMVHHESYDPAKYMSDRDILEYLRKLRRGSKPGYPGSKGDGR